LGQEIWNGRFTSLSDKHGGDVREASPGRVARKRKVREYAEEKCWTLQVSTRNKRL
jgi:hypothetical protein